MSQSQEKTDQISAPTSKSLKVTNRRWHPKVRSGCVRCKIRRVKCDELRPECIRCQKGGYKCGYDVPKTRVFTLEGPLRFDQPGDKRFYDFFVNEGSSLIVTFQPSSLAFWMELAPQLSQVHASVQFGLTALGAIQAPLHFAKAPKGALARPPKPELSPTVLNYLSKSMRLLAHANAQSVDTEVALACCLCYLAIAIWVERSGAPVLHIDAGLSILRDYQERVSADPLLRSSAVDDGLIPFFHSLVVNACALSDNYPTAKSGILANHALDLGLDRANYLLNFTDAFESLDVIIKCILRINMGSTAPRIREKVNNALAAYLDAFEDLHRRDVKTAIEHQRPQTANLDDLLHLQIHHRMAYIMFDGYERGDEMDFDSFLEDFEFIVEQSQIHIERTLAQHAGDPGHLRTSLGTIPPLFFVATKCRDRALRRTALELMHRSTHVERAWTSCIATTLANFVIEVEEGVIGTANEDSIPLSSRVILESVEHASMDSLSHLRYRFCTDDSLSPSRKASMRFRSHPSVEQDGETFPMASKVLRACGYSGVTLFTPRLQCHCATPLFEAPEPIVASPFSADSIISSPEEQVGT